MKTIELTDEEFNYLVDVIKFRKYAASDDLYWFTTDNLFFKHNDDEKFLNQKNKESKETITKCDELLMKLGVEE